MTSDLASLKKNISTLGVYSKHLKTYIIGFFCSVSFRNQTTAILRSTRESENNQPKTSDFERLNSTTLGPNYDFPGDGSGSCEGPMMGRMVGHPRWLETNVQIVGCPVMKPVRDSGFLGFGFRCFSSARQRDHRL